MRYKIIINKEEKKINILTIWLILLNLLLILLYEIRIISKVYIIILITCSILSFSSIMMWGIIDSKFISNQIKNKPPIDPYSLPHILMGTFSYMFIFIVAMIVYDLEMIPIKISYKIMFWIVIGCIIFEIVERYVYFNQDLFHLRKIYYEIMFPEYDLEKEDERFKNESLLNQIFDVIFALYGVYFCHLIGNVYIIIFLNLILFMLCLKPRKRVHNIMAKKMK